MVGVGAGAHGVLGVPRIARKPASLRRASRNNKEAPGTGGNYNGRVLHSTALSNAGRAVVMNDSGEGEWGLAAEAMNWWVEKNH